MRGAEKGWKVQAGSSGGDEAGKDGVWARSSSGRGGRLPDSSQIRPLFFLSLSAKSAESLILLELGSQTFMLLEASPRGLGPDSDHTILF